MVRRPVAATRGFQAMGRVYAGWGLSQAFYREEIWRKIGFSSLEDFLIESWEANCGMRTDADQDSRSPVS